jgi:hypothetical protein
MKPPSAYSCELIVRSRAVDPRRTAYMMEDEEGAWSYFLAMKDNLQSLFLHEWKPQFKICVDKFIDTNLEEAKALLSVPCENECQEEEERMCLHSIRRLVAGAVQEWELVQQPEYATRCAEIDGALVWQGRGYVILTRLLFHYLNHLPIPPRVHLKHFRQRYGW